MRPRVSTMTIDRPGMAIHLQPPCVTRCEPTPCTTPPTPVSQAPCSFWHGPGPLETVLSPNEPASHFAHAAHWPARLHIATRSLAPAIDPTEPLSVVAVLLKLEPKQKMWTATHARVRKRDSGTRDATQPMRISRAGNGWCRADTPEPQRRVADIARQQRTSRLV
jgi:hypothetical protein